MRSSPPPPDGTTAHSDSEDDGARASRITRWLETAPAAAFTMYGIAAAFITYFCMYAFRKPFAAAKFEGLQFANSGITLKTAFVISQILGYTLSKFIGIKVNSEVSRGRRAFMLVGLILCAELALLLFGLLPGSWKVVAIFANGIPLGMVWGLVVAYLEGRKNSEMLLAGLACSFIVASGAVKAVGVWLMNAHGVSEAWMPVAVGGIFLPLFVVGVWFLDKIPPQDDRDVAERVERAPMYAAERRAFLRRFLFGLAMLLGAYFFLTAYRDFRDNYMVEILEKLGYEQQAGMLARTELWVAFGVMLALAALNLIKDNRRGLIGAFGIMTLGLVLLGGGTLMFEAKLIRGDVWMVLTGLGAYLAYVPYNTVLFDRLVASTGVVATAVFTIYLADAVGYTGSVLVQLYKDLGAAQTTRLDFFVGFTYFMAAVGTAALVASLIYFLGKTKRGPGWRLTSVASRIG